jgi:hypothetical protein
VGVGADGEEVGAGVKRGEGGDGVEVEVVRPRGAVGLEAGEEVGEGEGEGSVAGDEEGEGVSDW